MARRSLTALVAFALVLLSVPLGASPAAAAPTELFFSEYIEGSSNNKALEIYNGTGAAIDLLAGGYSVQMFFNGAGNAGLTINLTGTVAAGDVYVVAQASAVPAILAQADQTNGAGWFNGDDAVWLIKGAGAIIDVIGQRGFDPGTEWGTGLTSTADNTLRRRSSVTAGDPLDTDPFDPSSEWDGFATDTFAGLGAHPDVPPPGDQAPTVSASSPANGAAGVALDANVTITFSESVAVVGDWYWIACAVSGPHAATASGGPTAFTLDPTADFSQSETCTVTVLAAQVTDQDASDPPDNMAGNHVFTFATIAPASTIRAIQGASHISPKVGQTVSGVNGIVTAKRGNGFYMQDPSPDADEATSEAIFVFTSIVPTVSVGNAVTVSGLVTEFRPGGTGGTTNLTTTEITGPTIVVTAPTNPLPAPIVVGAGGRLPPTEVIEDDASGDVETSGVFDPATDGIDFYESLEAMLVQVNDPVVAGPSRGPAIGELPVLADNGAGASGRTARGGVAVSVGDFNPERIFLDDEIMKFLGLAMPNAIVGDRITTAAVGVVDYSFGNFKVEVTNALATTATGPAREVTTAPEAHELAVATFNVENLDPNDPPAKFSDLAALIVTNLLAPDLIAVEELQDNTGATGPTGNNGTVAANITADMLVAAIQTAGGPTYQYRLIDPVNNQDGGEPGGNIRQAFLFRTDRGLAFVDRPGGGSTTATSVADVAGAPQLSASPGRIDPTNAAFNTSRKPLAGEFTYNGHTLFVVANHFNSKGGDQPLFGRFQPPTLGSETQRRAQATIVRDFARSILAIDENAKVVVMGDLNDFEFSNPIGILKETPLTDLIETLEPNEQYTYVFDGNSQTLDHIMVSDSLAGVSTTDVVHVNAEYFSRASDHDPQVAKLMILDTTPPTITAPGDILVDASSVCFVVIADAALGAASASDNVGPVTITRSGVPAGNAFPLGATQIAYTATDGGGNEATATQTVTVVDHTPPTIVAPSDASYQTSSDVPAASPSDATATDNCGSPTVIVAQTSNGGAGTPASPLVLTRTYTASDGSGNVASDIQTITVIDTTAPTISAAALPAANANGWNAGPVTVHFTCSDNSGSVNCPADVTLSMQGAGQSVTGMATDPSGNSSSTTVGPINIDTSRPSIVFSGTLAYTIDQTVAITCMATDALSGLDPAVTQTCQSASGPAHTFGTGAHTLSASATDRAGNTATATTTFTVDVTGRSLCQLIPRLVGHDGAAFSLCVIAVGAELAQSRGLDRFHDALLTAFERIVNRERGRSITEADADLLIALARQL